MLAVVDTVASQLRSNVRVPRTAVDAFPAVLDFAVVSAVKSKVVAVLSFVVAEVVAKLVASLALAYRWRRRRFLRSRVARLDCACARSAVSVFKVAVVSGFFEIFLDKSVASIANAALAAVSK